jgi:spermidine synthase
MMRALGRIWGGPPLYRCNGIEVRERGGVRTLHLDSDTVQSAMRVDRPDDLELSYTRTMMSFLLFQPPPRRVSLIGLGGGSLAKFMYRRMPEARVTAVEVDADVIDVARVYFGLPEPCGRLAFVVMDGARYVESVAGTLDALLVDAYDGSSLAASLSTERFFRAARSALRADGVFAMNLWANDAAFDRYVHGIERAFDGACLCLPAERPGNVIVLGFERMPPRDGLDWVRLQERARLLQDRFGLEFPAFVSNLRRMNRHDRSGLVLQQGDA